MIRHSPTVPVYDVMTRMPITVAPGTPLGTVLSLFDRHDFHAFPVVDGRGVICGILTKLDVLRAFRPDPSLDSHDVAAVSARRVEVAMRRGVVSVEAGDSALRAADLMVETRLHSLPVVERKAVGPVLVGIVSQGDLLRALRFGLAESSVGALP
jgi:CBS domain-containing protein